MKSYLADYELVASDSLPSALKLLANGEGWRPIAGGTDLMVLLNAGTLPCRRFFSLCKLDELRQITVSASSVTIGAAVTYSQIRSHPILQAEFPLLCQAAGWTGGIANQNQGTLGGNIANASPAADSAPPLLVYDAEIRLSSLEGKRSVRYADFHLGYKKLAMGPDELIYEIDLPRRASIWHDYGRKVGTRRAQAISKVSFAGAARIENRRIADVRLAFGSVGSIPLRCCATEQFLLEKRPTTEIIGDARRILKSEIAPIDDIRSTAAYRLNVTQNLLSEFIETLQ